MDTLEDVLEEKGPSPKLSFNSSKMLEYTRKIKPSFKNNSVHKPHNMSQP